MELRPELKLIAELLKSLNADGVIRSKNLVGDLGEYYCKNLFDLKVNKNPVEKGFDAKDNEDMRIQIKTRRTPEGKNKIIFRNFDFDYCLFVELNEYFEPTIIIKVLRTEIMENCDSKGDRLSVSKMRQTKHIVKYENP